CLEGRRRVSNQRATCEIFPKSGKPRSGPQPGSHSDHIDAGRATKVTSDTADGLTGTGVLQIRDNRLPLTVPLTISQHDDHLHLEASIDVDRAAAGVGWSKMGMIKGPAQLHVNIALVRQD
ncbi:MAG: hypothetical protein ACR2NR_06090, partial [Solirubrobacteraceae bacterium]